MKSNPAAAPEKRLLLVTAAAGIGSDLTRVEGVAYSGGTYTQWWSDAPCVTDLAGLEIAPQIPLMYNHINDPEFRLGELTVTKSETALIVSGGIDPESERGAEIIAAGKKCEWQLSHGAEIVEAVKVRKDEKRTVNGREFAGPLLVITKAVLREISVVAIGADADTSLRIAAGFGKKPLNPISNEGGNMEKKEPVKQDVNAAAVVPAADPAKPAVSAGAPAPAPATVPAADPADVKAAAETAVKAERERVAEVRAALKDYPTLVDKAISCGWTVDHCKELVENVKSVMAGLPQTGTNIIVKDKPQTSAAVLEAALEFRAGISEKVIVAAHGEQVTEQADKMRGLTLKEALIAACGLKGIHVGVTIDHDVIQAGFSTTDLPFLLSNVAHKAMLKEFEAYPVIATKLCSEGDLADYKEALRVRMTDIGDLEAVPVGGEVPNSTIGEEGATNKAERYAKAFWLDEALIINDDLGGFLRIPKIFGARAARKIDKVFFSRLLANPVQADGNALFSAAHRNYQAGSSYALSLDGLKSMRTLFLNQTDADGEPISIVPKFLVVPTTLEAAAQELVNSVLIVSGENKTQGNANVVNRWNLEVVSSPYLENAKYPGYSTTGWYYFADPAQVDTFEIGYLRGQKVPTVERGQFDLSHFGVSYRVRFDFGIREQDFRGMTFAPGVASSSSSSSSASSESSGD